MKLYIMRHGQTQANKEKMLQGRIDISLNEEGRIQAKEEREKFEQEGIRFDTIYASPLKRAKETAMIISGKTEEEIIIDNRIIEMNFGPYEKVVGYKSTEMYNFFKYPEECGYVEGVETYHSLLERSTAFIDDIVSKPEYKDKNILVVSHGATIHAIMLYVDKERLNNIWKHDIGNCGYFVVEKVGDTLVRTAQDFKAYNRIPIFSRK